MKTMKYIALLTVTAVVLSVGCSNDKQVTSDRQPTAVTVSLLKSSLAATVQRVTLQVRQNDQLVHADTTAVLNGEFSFDHISLNTGVTTFAVNALDGANKIVYTGNTTITVLPDRVNSVSLLLLPAEAMVKLSPYWSEEQNGAPFMSRLEFYNVAKFRNGSYTITYNSDLVRLDSLSVLNNSWGELTFRETEANGGIGLLISRVSSTDSVPENVPGLLGLWFTSLSTGVTNLGVVVQQMNDDLGLIRELRDSTLIADGQTVSISGTTGYGTLSGVVNGADNGLPLDSVSVAVTGPAQRSTLADVNGLFTFAELPFGTYQVTASRNGYVNATRRVQFAQAAQSINLVMTQILDSTKYRVVLTWGEKPSDLDAHLWTLGQEVFYSQKGSLDSIPYAFLDVDERNGYGPETITIKQLRDTCKYAVFNYSRTPDIIVSRAHVDLYKGAAVLRSFDVPTAGTGLWWYVFDLTPSGDIVVRDSITVDSPGGSQLSGVHKPARLPDKN